MDRYIIGVHSGHDASACLFKNNKLIYAIEKERLTRIKHDEGEPIECIKYLLDSAKILPKNVDLVVRSNWYNSNLLNNSFYKKFPNVIENFQHHLLHAYALSLVNQGQDMIIFVVDGRGCRPIDCNYFIEKADDNLFESESIYYLRNKFILPIKKVFSIHKKNVYKWGSFLNSLGYIYNSVSKSIFSDNNSAGKVMALSSFGKDNNKIPNIFIDKNYNEINQKFLDFINSLDLPINWKSNIAKDLSFKVQQALENYFNNRINNYIRKYRIHNIGIIGGTALNCKNNGKISNLKNVKKLNLFPACGDNSLSIGAAVWAIREYYLDTSTIIWSVYSGKKYKDTIIDNNEITRLVNLLKNNVIIGLFEKESEFGPRALCHRSIICKASNIDMKNRLNDEIKHRENFRPFGGVILEENLHKITNEKIFNPYMLVAVKIKDSYKIKVPALLHIDNTVRIQIIKDKTSLIYHILKKYEQLTGEIMLINTSFNAKEEPIVETEVDAIHCASKIKLPYVMISGKLIKIL